MDIIATNVQDAVNQIKVIGAGKYNIKFPSGTDDVEAGFQVVAALKAAGFTKTVYIGGTTDANKTDPIVNIEVAS